MDDQKDNDMDSEIYVDAKDKEERPPLRRTASYANI